MVSSWDRLVANSKYRTTQEIKDYIVNIGLQIPSYADCIAFGYIPTSGIFESYGRFTFSCLSTVHTDFPNGYTGVYSYQQWSSSASLPTSMLLDVIRFLIIGQSHWS